MGTGTLTPTPLWNRLQSQTSRFAQGVCVGLCFRSVCFCSRQPSWADDFSYSSLEWLSQQQIISSVAHLFWQELSSEMALLRLAKKRVQRNESAIEKCVGLRGSLCELHTWTDAQHLPLECYFSCSDVCPLAHYSCLTRVDSLRLVSLSLCSAKIKKQMHKLNTSLSFCMEMLDIYKKDENGFQGHVPILIYMATTQISFVQSQIAFQPPWKQPKEMYEDGGSCCRLKMVLGLTWWTGLKKQRWQTISLIISVNILRIRKRTGPLWTWKEPWCVDKESAISTQRPTHFIFNFFLMSWSTWCLCYSDTWALSFSIKVLAAVG